MSKQDGIFSKYLDEKGQPRKLRKISTDVLKLEPGDKIEGIYLDQNERPWADKTTGEAKTITALLFEKDNKERVIVFQDAGLKSAMQNAMIKVGDHVVIEKKAKTDLGGGRSVNQYDIFQYED